MRHALHLHLHVFLFDSRVYTSVVLAHLLRGGAFLLRLLRVLLRLLRGGTLLLSALGDASFDVGNNVFIYLSIM